MTPPETSQPSGEPRLSTYTHGGYNVAALSGELDIASAPVLREQLLDVLGPKASKLIVDLSQVSFCDASGLTVLIGTNRRARLLGGFLRLAAPAPPVAWALRITGLDLQLDIFPTLAAAIAGAPASPRIADGRKRGHTDMAVAGHAGDASRTPMISVKRSRLCSRTPTHGVMPTPTASSPSRSARWTARTPAWTAPRSSWRRDHCWLLYPGIP